MESLNVAFFCWESMYAERVGGLACAATNLAETLAKNHNVHYYTRGSMPDQCDVSPCGACRSLTCRGCGGSAAIHLRPAPQVSRAVVSNASSHKGSISRCLTCNCLVVEFDQGFTGLKVRG